ncbi:TNF receptor-associated factor 5-like [Acropora millepora]|uniref:TNF receptor-associated factor 5-like n=1 Tax=Acropora millepora TaxID=45264 RepID=UPI001CF23274|nr:TNF receptor-associated factor 5-like [Acropora millepora]
MSQTTLEPTFNCRFSLPLDQQLLCSICYNTMLKPVSLNCGHSGCFECLKELSKKTLAPKCPMWRKDFQAANICMNIALDHVTRALSVECLSVGCGWKGGYGNAFEHFSNCPKLPIKCNNVECQHVVVREDMPIHAVSCMKRKVQCPDCKKDVKREMLHEHQAGQCDNAVIPCPLNCGSAFSRDKITLHLSDCQERATLCKVPGCKRILKKKDMTSHLIEAATSHYVLQLNEIKRLRRLIYNKTSQLETVVTEVERVASFRWTFVNFPEMTRGQGDAMGNEPVTSDHYGCEGHTWRGLLRSNGSLFLQLLSASHPVTAEIRIVMMPGTEKEKVFHSDTVTLSEGEMWGTDIHVNSFVDENGRLEIKFLIYYLNI